MSGIAWKSQRDGFLDSLHYMKGRMEGIIRSIKTPWPKVNDATVDGFEWNSMIVIGGRPGSGKTLLKDQIIREAFDLNPGEDFRVLEFSLEMVSRVSAIREYSSITGKTYKHLCSADGKITQEELDLCYQYAKKKIKYPIDIVEKAPTVKEFSSIIRKYMDNYSKEVQAPTGEIKKVYTKTLITLDHSILIKKSPNEKTKTDMLYNLGEEITSLKRDYPLIFIILSQLGRDVDKPERNEDGKYGNYILDSDIFGGDALLQHADTLIGLNRPARQKIRFYGPERYIIENDQVLVMHYLKCRNGDGRMSFFKTEYNKMKLVEMQTPARSQRKVAM